MLPIPGSGEPVPACDEPGPSASNVELEACYAIGPEEDVISEVSPIPLPLIICSINKELKSPVSQGCSVKIT